MTTLMFLLTLMLFPYAWERSANATVRRRSRSAGRRPNLEDGE